MQFLSLNIENVKDEDNCKNVTKKRNIDLINLKYCPLTPLILTVAMLILGYVRLSKGRSAPQGQYPTGIRPARNREKIEIMGVKRLNRTCSKYY